MSLETTETVPVLLQAGHPPLMTNQQCPNMDDFKMQQLANTHSGQRWLSESDEGDYDDRFISALVLIHSVDFNVAVTAAS